MFRRFGSEVTIIEAGPRLIAREDEDVSDAIRNILEREGIHIRLNTTCKRFAKDGDAIVLTAESAGEVGELRGSDLLVATGRRSEYRRSRTRQGRRRDRSAGLYYGRRSVAHQRTRHMGLGRL